MPKAIAIGRARRTLAVTGLNHALHDGYTDLIYILLPLWQGEFALDYGALAVLRACYTGTMAVLQVPSARLAQRLGLRTVLVLGTVLAAAGYGYAGVSGGLMGLCLALSIGGSGSSTQHPLASTAIARAYGASARGPLGTYNFAGDLGKAALPMLVALLLTRMSWRPALFVVALLGLAVAAVVRMLMPAFGRQQAVTEAKRSRRAGGRGGFGLLFAIGILDSSVRMGFLMFLPFILRTKGADLPMTGFALTLVSLGGAIGKFVCGWLGGRWGLLATVLGTEIGTAAAIFGVILLPLAPAMAVLPLLGIMLNGTSSVLYGTVPELAREGQADRAFALFYTGTIGSGALSPVLYGLVGDVGGPGWGAASAAVAALLTCPLAVVLAPRLAPER
jgi:MFS family permease